MFILDLSPMRRDEALTAAPPRRDKSDWCKMHEYPRTVPHKYLQQAIQQTRRVVYPDDWTPVYCA